jgi:NAD(P)-dependent dehydrogenase (short-subunit alcohol dehydrogenase family)
VDIQGKNALVLGGYGLVGSAVCRKLLEHEPARLVVASLRQWEAEAAVACLRQEHPTTKTVIVPAWGDLMLRAEWQQPAEDVHPRTAVLADQAKRRRLVGDILDELTEDSLTASLLYQLILGQAPGLEAQPAQIVVDCVNTATAVAYQNVFQMARRLQGRIASSEATDWPEEIERLLSSLYVPQLVRHIQIFYEAMLRAKTQAYVKVGTSGTGGMGFNIPYTHGEERPSRVLLSKSAVAGAQTMLLFLLARTPGGPAVVKEIKPTAAIAWKEIGYGPIRRAGREIALFDCLPEQAPCLSEPGALEPEARFGRETGEILRSVYIDTGENGLFSVGEFSAITTLGQMEFVTPEEIAANVVAEITGHNTGTDVIAALDGAVMGPTYRAGFLRQAALAKLRQLEAEHGVDSVAFEILGPPRLSKLLYEAHLLKRACGTLAEALKRQPEALAASMAEEIAQDASLRQRILSIGIPILLPDGQRLLRGPAIKSQNAEHGWVDLTPANLAHWQERLAALRAEVQMDLADREASSRLDRAYPAALAWQDVDAFDEGEIAGWIFIHEEKGARGKA